MLNYFYTCQDWKISVLWQMELVAIPWAKSVLCDYFGLEIGRDGHAANYNYYIACTTCYVIVLISHKHTYKSHAHPEK